MTRSDIRNTTGGGERIYETPAFEIHAIIVENGFAQSDWSDGTIDDIWNNVN